MKSIFSILMISLLLSGCVKNNQDPAWIEITKWDLQSNSAVTPNSVNDPGVLSSNFSDAWIYMDGDLVGVFELPVKLPIIKDGAHTFKLYPAVQNNGISATKKIYPFVEPYEVIVDLVQNEVATINPNTRYYSNVEFWIEDFEDASIRIADGPSSLVQLEKVSGSPIATPELNGNSFGRISLTTSNYIWIASTIANNNGQLNMNLPRGQEVYLEIDYHNTNELTTGVLAINTDGTTTDNRNIRLNPQTENVKWKKIYIDLREIVSASVNASYFEFSFQSILDSGDSSGEVNIDNIKAVYF